ncbi:MAG: DUF4340 domain-containing protein [Candidatus Firestonebacteria bacterium]|nr:DUF4340 domain-containing protein [Candidatus Firestonebacteria bacterium]
MHKKNLLIAGGVFVLLLAYVLITQTGNRGFNTVRLPSLEKITVEDMAQIEITRLAGKLVLEKKDKVWSITSPWAFPVEKSKAENAERTLAEVRLTDVITEQSDRDADFGLNSPAAIGLRLAGSKQRHWELTVGKANAAGTHTFVRLPGDKKVYQVLGDLASLLNTPAEQWRSLQVYDFSPDSVQSFSLTRGKKTLSVQKAQEPDAAAVLAAPGALSTTPRPLHTVWRAEREPKVLNDPKVNQWIGTLARLTAARIVDNAPPAAKVWAQIAVKTPQAEYHLEFLEKGPQGKTYWVRRSGETLVYEIPDYQGQNLLKESKDLL